MKWICSESIFFLCPVLQTPNYPYVTKQYDLDFGLAERNSKTKNSQRATEYFNPLGSSTGWELFSQSLVTL